jgi:hypothetical protein
MKKFFSWIKWKLKGKPTISYTGYNCGLCGKWVDKSFSVPTYKSLGSWWDTWSVCEECLNKSEEVNNG